MAVLTDGDLVRSLSAGPFEGSVAYVRSFDGGVYLLLTNGLNGWHVPESKGHAICAASEATGKKVWVKYDSHDPNYGNGAGLFSGVKMAFDPRLL